MAKKITTLEDALVEIDALTAQNTELEKANKLAEKSLKEATKKSESLEKENTELVELTADLKTKLAASAKDLKKASKETIVKHDKKSYKVTIPSFRHNGKVYTPEVLAEDSAAIKELVEMGSDVLEEVQ